MADRFPPARSGRTIFRAAPSLARQGWSPGLLVSSALFGFFISCVFALLATPLARRAGVAMGWRDRPDDAHKGHFAARPYAGGMAVLTAIALALVCTRLAFPEYAGALTDVLLAVGPGALLIAAVGLLDDLRGCRPAEKLIVQAVALLLFQTSAFALGFAVDLVASATAIAIGAVLLNAWMLGLTNSMNLIDGMDGLAAGLATVSALGIAVVGILFGDAAVASLAAILAGASLGFRRNNRAPARIYLGDGGSLLLGFCLAATGAAIWLHRPGVAEGVALLLMAWVPMLDTTTTIVRRTLSGVALFQADRDHVHHRLLARGGSTHSVGRHLIGLQCVASVCALCIHAGIDARLALLVTVVASTGTVRAAFPLRVTTPVDRGTIDTGSGAVTPRTQERAA